MTPGLARAAAVAGAVAALIPHSTARGGEAKPPVLFHTPARQATAGEPLPVEGLLIGGQKVDKVYLRYRARGEPFRTAELEIQYGDLYRGAVPARAVRPPAVEYFIQGVTFDGQPVLLYQSERRPARVKVAAAPASPRPEPLVAPREAPRGTIDQEDLPPPAPPATDAGLPPPADARPGEASSSRR